LPSTAVNLKSSAVKQHRNFANFLKKQRPDLSVEISILLFFILPKDLLAGKINALTGKH
jgi:hypothetical protein